MPSYKDCGIVISSFSLGEFDKVLNIYTKENGLVRAIAKGLKKNKSKFSGKLEVLSNCLFHFAKGKNLDIVIDCIQLNSFPQLHLDLKRLTYGLLYLEVVGNFASELDSDSEKIYELLCMGLDRLQDTKDPHLLTLSFLIKFLLIHGFKPQLNTCVSCSKKVRESGCTEREKNYLYSSILGGLLCNECSKVVSHKLVNPELLNIIEYASDLGFVSSGLRCHEVLEKFSYEDIRETTDLIIEHINVRARSRIKSFDLVVTL